MRLLNIYSALLPERRHNPARRRCRGGDQDHHIHPSLRSGQAYDSLYRLTTAVYTLKGAGDTGEYFYYTYDDVGNRLTEEKKTSPAGLVESTSYILRCAQDRPTTTPTA